MSMHTPGTLKEGGKHRQDKSLSSLIMAQLGTGRCTQASAEWCCIPVSTREPVNGSVKLTQCLLTYRRCMSKCALFPLLAAERLTDVEAEDLMAWMRNALGTRVTGVKVGILHWVAEYRRSTESTF